jgi:hypothetical protein
VVKSPFYPRNMANERVSTWEQTGGIIRQIHKPATLLAFSPVYPESIPGNEQIPVDNPSPTISINEISTGRGKWLRILWISRTKTDGGRRPGMLVGEKCGSNGV